MYYFFTLRYNSIVDIQVNYFSLIFKSNSRRFLVSTVKLKNSDWCDVDTMIAMMIGKKIRGGKGKQALRLVFKIVGKVKESVPRIREQVDTMP